MVGAAAKSMMPMRADTKRFVPICREKWNAPAATARATGPSTIRMSPIWVSAALIPEAKSFAITISGKTRNTPKKAVTNIKYFIMILIILYSPSFINFYLWWIEF